MALVPFKICVTRLVGTSSLRASSAALIWSACSSSARCSPGWIAVTAIKVLLVIVDNLDVRRTRRAVRPLETDSPLIVNANAELALAVADQSFKAIPGQYGKVSQGHGRLQPIELQARGTLKTRERLDPFTACEIPSPMVPIADDH